MIRLLLIIVTALVLVPACERRQDTTTTGTSTTDTTTTTDTAQDAIENTEDAITDAADDETGVLAGGGTATTFNASLENATATIHDTITALSTATKTERETLATQLETTRDDLQTFYENETLNVQGDWTTLQTNFNDTIDKVRAGAADAQASLETLLAQLELNQTQ